MSSKEAVLLLALVLAIGLGCAGVRGQEPTAQGKSVSYWIEELQHTDMERRLRASEVLRGMGKAAVPHLVRALQQEKPEARLRVLSTLNSLGSDAVSALPAISSLLGDDSLPVRVTAVATIMGMDCACNDELWPIVIAGLEGDSFSASVAATAVGTLGADGVRAVPALVRLVKSTDRELQLAALGALWKIGPAAKIALPALKETVKAGGQIGMAAESAIATITGEAPTPVPPCQERRFNKSP